MRDARSSIFNKLLITKDASEKQVVELYSNIELGRATVKHDDISMLVSKIAHGFTFSTNASSCSQWCDFI